ncbi:hypothetical protein GCM10027188_29730 [Lysobacter humi (ex Lee et al. 2017)]
MLDTFARYWIHLSVWHVVTLLAGIALLVPLSLALHGSKRSKRMVTSEMISAVGTAVLVLVWLCFVVYNRYPRG